MQSDLIVNICFMYVPSLLFSCLGVFIRAVHSVSLKRNDSERDCARLVRLGRDSVIVFARLSTVVGVVAQIFYMMRKLRNDTNVGRRVKQLRNCAPGACDSSSLLFLSPLRQFCDFSVRFDDPIRA